MIDLGIKFPGPAGAACRPAEFVRLGRCFAQALTRDCVEDEPVGQWLIRGKPETCQGCLQIRVDTGRARRRIVLEPFLMVFRRPDTEIHKHKAAELVAIFRPCNEGHEAAE